MKELEEEAAKKAAKGAEEAIPEIPKKKPYQELKDRARLAVTNAEKGQVGEDLADLVMQRTGRIKVPSKVGSNNGFDGLYFKYSKEGGIVDIIINESKFGKARLGKTLMGKQMSNK
ncbi:hypothetical protein [Paenibacillus woosongensis]|uniref:Uncharacterized protein n=1 Tax=Paenibacillus woosongensis TaxID=307580 RepID=A0A7X2YZI1_9BACL|nr:hypothetical protein [Paenibacillus woosongensis]MUG44318.1 hypothetical protein [Paenibacillus woosongensis]